MIRRMQASAASGEEMEFIYCGGRFDFDYLEKVRQELPLLKHRRTDLYELHRI